MRFKPLFERLCIMPSPTVVLLALLGSGLMLSGCGGDGKSEDQAKEFSQTIVANRDGIVSTQLEENSGYVHIRGTQQFALIGIDGEGEKIDLSSKAIWRISDRNLGSISDSGFFRPKGIAGEFVLTAEFAGQSQSQSIIVSDANLVGVTVTNAATSVDVCKNTTFGAEALFNNGLILTYPLTWSLAEPSDLASFPNAERSIMATYGSGSVSVRATGLDNTGVSVPSPAFDFLIADTLSSLAISASNGNTSTGIRLREGQQTDITVTATYIDTSTANITANAKLSVSPTSAGRIVAASGLFTAGTGSYAGTEATVTGTCGDETIDLVITVLKPAIESIEIKNSNNNTDSASLTQGSSTDLSVSAILEGDGGTDTNYTYNLEWSIDEEQSGAFNSDHVSINSSGRLTTSANLNLSGRLDLVVSVRILDSNGNTLRNSAGDELTDTIFVYVNP